MSFLRFLMLMALIVWLGSLIFFPVVASTAFSVLPTTQLAGSVVRRSLVILHWMGIVSGVHLPGQFPALQPASRWRLAACVRAARMC